MTPEPAVAPAPPPPPPAPARAPIWRQALRLIRENPRQTLLPMAVFQAPLALLIAASYFYLYHQAYPEADFQSFNRFDDSPSGLVLSLIIMTAVYTFLSLVATAATIVAVKAVIDRRPVSLVESLDPAFTRMGGLLLIGALLYGIVLGSAAGIIVLLYLLFRWGLAIHAHMLESTGVLSSLGVSWRILRGNMLRFIGVSLTTLPVALIAFTAGSIVVAIGLAPFGADPGRTASLAAQSLSVLLIGFVAVPTAAYFAAATTIFYVSLKEQSRA